MSLDKTLAQLAFERPFLGHLASQLGREVRARAADSMVWPIEINVTRTGAYRLVVDEVAFDRHTERERLVLVEHELLHLVFRHPERAFGDRWVYGIAADLVVNQYLSLGGLVAGMRTVEDYKLPRGLDAAAYYALLEKKDCDGAAACAGFCDQNPWASASARAHAANAGARHTVDEAIYRSWVRLGHTEPRGKSAGRLPDSVWQALKELIERIEGHLDWRVLLRRFAASGRTSRIKNTMRRPSKRYGTFPGTKLKRQQRVSAIVDTSGSIGEDELVAFFAEIDRLYKAGADVEVIEADAEVQRRSVYRGVRPAEVQGRGGTRFDPALSAVRERRRSVDLCLYLTDGVAPSRRWHRVVRCCGWSPVRRKSTT